MAISADDLRSKLPPTFSTKDAFQTLESTYSDPSALLVRMEKAGHLYRLRKGVYAFTKNFDPLTAAGVLHGPSYISFETALAYYGLIPERVEQIMSVVDGRPVTYNTPVGLFRYYSQCRSLYAAGVTLEIGEEHTLHIATKEKAVLDTLDRAKLKARMMSPEKVLEYVVDGLRIDYDQVKKLSRRKIKKMSSMYRNLGPRRLSDALLRRGANE